MKLALSLLCEHPKRKTGLTSLFTELVARSLDQYEDLEWVVYVAPDHDWSVQHERLNVKRCFPGSDDMKKRLIADHFLFAKDAKKEGADAILTVGFVPILTAGLPVIMHMLSLQHLTKGNNVGLLRSSYRKWAASHGLANAKLVITNTEFAISQILGVNPEVEPKIIQSYEGLQQDFYTPEAEEGEVERLKEKFNIKPGYLYWCSNFYPYKQAEKFFDAYALLSEEERQRLPVVMVGGGWGDGVQKALSHAEQLGISDCVTKLGWIDDEDLAMLYRQSKMHVLASREETFGRSVAESMACGRPCVVNSIPVMKEVTGGHALIVDFDKKEVVANAFRKLLEDEGFYDSLALAGIDYAKKFDFDLLAKERIDAIKKIINK